MTYQVKLQLPEDTKLYPGMQVEVDFTPAALEAVTP